MFSFEILNEIFSSAEYLEFMKNEFYSVSLNNLPYEIWKYIPDTENRYMVSNYGRIKSVGWFNNNIDKWISKNIILSRIIKSINPFICLTIDNKSSEHKIEKFVGDLFVRIPEYLIDYNYTREKLQLIHLDNNNMNNCSWNLRWIISEEYIRLQNLPGEIWKPVENTNNQYLVSNKGRIKSLYYIRNNNIIYREYMLSPIINARGYCKVTIKFNNEKISKLVSVHRLVAQAFIPNPNNLPYINHKDENKENNCVENLEWCTPEYNNIYGTRLERVSQAQSKPITQFDLEGNFIANYPSSSKAAKLLNYERRAIDHAVTGKSKISYSSIWKETKPEYKPGYKLPKDEINIPLSSLANQPKTLYIYDLESNQLINKCESLAKASLFLKISRSKIRDLLKKGGIYNNYLLKYIPNKD